VVLLPKPGKDPLLLSSYKPISILPALSKVWEHTFKILIERSLGMDPFHKEQYGFRRRRGTIDALDRVCGIVEACRKRGLVCVLVALDVKNAFNTLSWRKILETITERQLPRQLQVLLSDYLSERKILTYCCDGKVKRNVYAELTRNTVRYLGVLINNARWYSPHLEQVCDKAERFVGAIRSLLVNVNGPTDTMRKLYSSSIIWASALNMEKNKKILRSAQRTALVRTSTAYRTMPHATLCVVTGSMPIHIRPSTVGKNTR
jgi:hypothetical protein